MEIILKELCKGLATMFAQRRNAPVLSFLEKIIFKQINVGRKTQLESIFYDNYMNIA